jgi:hypothetical protein
MNLLNVFPILLPRSRLMRSVCLSVSAFQLSNLLTSFYEIWYEVCVVGGHLDIVLLNLVCGGRTLKS